MKKASFLTRLRFSYTVALLEIFAAGVRERYSRGRKDHRGRAKAAYGAAFGSR